MNADRLPVLLVAGFSLVYAACGGDNLTLPSEGDPASITVLSGDGQIGRVTSPLGQPLVVLVKDNRDLPVPGATVQFAIDNPVTGTASPAEATTDANGEASSSITLGSQVGPVTGHATVPVPEGTAPVNTAFTAMAVSDNANGIAMVSGDGQSGQVGSTLPNPLVVQVTDRFGNPIAGIDVQWSVTGGGGLSEQSTRTGDNGQTSVTRVLGTTAGEQTTVASAAGLVGSPITFSHTATAGSATGLVKISGDGQSGPAGSELPAPLVVKLLDAQSNPIVGRAVTWVIGNGGGSVTPVTSNTDGQGQVTTRWTLGPSPGNNTVSAVVSGVGTATFSATGTAGSPSASRSSVSVSPGSIVAGIGTSTITVRVKDASGNPINGASVSVSSSGSGNSISPATATTGDDGLATFTFNSTVAETKTITAVAGGVTLDEKPEIAVVKAGSRTQVTVPVEPSTSGTPVHVTFTVTGDGGGTPTGQVTIVSDKEPAASCTVPVEQGFCDLTLSVVGNHKITATYSGDTRFEASHDDDNHQVIAAPPPTNMPPVAAPDGYATPTGQTLSVTPPGVLANDADPDGDTLTAELLTQPAIGLVVLSSDGSFTYFPGSAASGTQETFTYNASDGTLTSTATVTITIQ